MSGDKPTTLARSLRRVQIAGFLVIGVLVLGIGGWAAGTEIAGAVIASGQISVRSNAKKVQHLEGGIVRELNVQNGDRVAAGDILARLDETDTRATLEIIDAEYVELLVQQARLKSERERRADLNLPDELEGFADHPGLDAIIDSEKHLLTSRLESLKGKQDQLQEQIAQNGNQVSGLEAQRSAREKELSIASQELETLKGLEEKGLVQKSRLLVLERELAKLEGDRGGLISEMARLKGESGEIGLRIIQIEDDRRSEVLANLAEVRTRIAALRQQRQAAQARFDRLDIVAPLDGFVHELAIFSSGTVIGSGEPIMLIVPEGEALVVRGRVRPQDIDTVHLGQEARIRLTAFSQRTTPELIGEVLTVGADISIDPVTKAGYYAVDISIPPFDPDLLEGEHLRPGMPAEIFIQTGQRTALSYLLKPLTDQVGRMWRE
jgi:HlyD family secretion protein